MFQFISLDSRVFNRNTARLYHYPLVCRGGLIAKRLRQVSVSNSKGPPESRKQRARRYMYHTRKNVNAPAPARSGRQSHPTRLTATDPRPPHVSAHDPKSPLVSFNTQIVKRLYSRRAPHIDAAYSTEALPASRVLGTVARGIETSASAHARSSNIEGDARRLFRRLP